MSKTMLMPVQVNARVVTKATTAPPLRGASEVPLGAGVHVHWALPDALTNACAIQTPQGQQMLFPGVPDLWLVVRWDPVEDQRARFGARAAAPPAPVRAVATALAQQVGPVFGPPSPTAGGGVSAALITGRKSRSWIVESRNQRVRPLASWTPPDDDPGQVFTAVGALASASDLGWSGWGKQPKSSDLNLYAASYYPECQNRFGLYDDLSDLGASPSGTVTYAVVGWYRYLAHDPIAQTFDPYKLMAQWKVVAAGDMSAIPVPPPVWGLGDQSGYLPPIARTEALSPDRDKRLRDAAVVKASALGKTSDARVAAVHETVGEMASAVNGAIVDNAVLLGHGVQRQGPDQLVCHGCVLDVALGHGALDLPRKPQLLVVPSMQRALAEVAASGHASPQEEDKVGLEVLILNADSALQARTTAYDKQKASSTDPALPGLLNDLHARTFQHRPGQSAFYAQLTLDPPPPPAHIAPHGPIASSAAPEAVVVGGRPPLTIGPSTPYPAFVDQLEQAMSAIHTPEIDGRFLRVLDNRVERTGATRAPGRVRGPAGASYWVDTTSEDELNMLWQATAYAEVKMPGAAPDGLFEVPGPRWHRPWSPHVILQGVGRGYRFGCDGRFDSDGLLQCRIAGHLLSSIGISPKGAPATRPVTGDELLGNATSTAGAPWVARSLLAEVMLLDPDNAAAMAAQWLAHDRADHGGPSTLRGDDVAKLFWAEIIANGMALHDPDAAEGSDAYEGIAPSPVAFVPWQPPWEPLFANIHYTFQGMKPAPLGMVEMDIDASAPVGAPIAATERQLLTPVLANTLESATVSNQVSGFDPGVLVPVNRQSSVTTRSFLKMNVLSASLTRFDDNLFQGGAHLRSGRLDIDQVQLVDAFGSTWTLTPPANPATWSTALTARFPDWARLQVRLMSAAQANAEASFGATPVCGYLLPDLIEHTLEIYDDAGVPLGQLVSGAPVLVSGEDPPKQGDPFPSVRFEAHPLRTPIGPDPATVITNDYLRSFVVGVCRAAATEVGPEPGASPSPAQRFRESSLTAFLRVVDTLRATVDPVDASGEHRVRMVGSPLALVRVRVWMERASGAALTDDPKLHGDGVGPLAVKVGVVTEIGDGVMGCFLPATNPQGDNAHFRPTDADAANHAVLGGLLDGTSGVGAQKVYNQFVHDPAGADTTFPLDPAQPLDLLLVLDLRGGIYVTSGVLPRKKITLPREFLSGMLDKLSPSFRIGPVLAWPTADQTNPFIPPPAVPGYQPQWIEQGDPRSEPLPQLPPDGVIANARVSVTQGWINLVPKS